MDVLRLSEDHHEWLRIMGSNSLFSDASFNSFVEDVIEAVLQPGHEIGALSCRNGASADNVAVKQCVAGLACLVVEAAKRDSASDTIGLYLQALEIPAERAKIVIEAYGKRKPELRRALSSIGFSLPHVVDVDWRLDYSVMSKDLLHAAEPQYQIDLQTLSGSDGLGSIKFSASVEELQEMVWKLKEAVRALERHSGAQ